MLTEGWEETAVGWSNAPQQPKPTVKIAMKPTVKIAGLLPRTGLLSFFADLSPESDGYCAAGAILHADTLGTLARRVPPEGVALVVESGINWSPTISLPVPEGPFTSKARLRDGDLATYNDRVFVPSLQGAGHQWLGYPRLTEVDEARADDHCLLQIASDRKRKLSFGDAQALRFELRLAALSKSDFRRPRVTASEP